MSEHTLAVWHSLQADRNFGGLLEFVYLYNQFVAAAEEFDKAYDVASIS
jgi:hypothetical protein